jgi:hypothetical protein
MATPRPSKPSPTHTLIPTVTVSTENKQFPTPIGTQLTKDIIKATVAAYGAICDLPDSNYYYEISPDGLWIAMVCEGKNGELGSYLRVVSIQGSGKWTIFFDDYSKGLKDPDIGYLHPYHWSRNGKNLYITAPSRISGCCWMGGWLLLTRLNLENGRQTTIANYASDGHGPAGADFSISSSERYVLYTPQNGIIYILDLLTWKQKAIELKFENTGAGETLMSNDDRKIILIIRQYPEGTHGELSDLTYGSLVLLDLETGSQKILLSGYEFSDTPKPFGWKDDANAWLCHDMSCDKRNLLLLNIYTGELTEVRIP